MDEYDAYTVGVMQPVILVLKGDNETCKSDSTAIGISTMEDLSSEVTDRISVLCLLDPDSKVTIPGIGRRIYRWLYVVHVPTGTEVIRDSGPVVRHHTVERDGDDAAAQMFFELVRRDSSSWSRVPREQLRDFFSSVVAGRDG